MIDKTKLLIFLSTLAVVCIVLPVSLVFTPKVKEEIFFPNNSQTFRIDFSSSSLITARDTIRERTRLYAACRYALSQDRGRSEENVCYNCLSIAENNLIGDLENLMKIYQDRYEIDAIDFLSDEI